MELISKSEPRVAIVGEAWGEEEEIQGRPFVGPTGRFLSHCLRVAGIDRRSALLTNVFNLRPRPSNDIKNLCGGKLEGIPGYPALVQNKYVLSQYRAELVRLHTELDSFRPTLIIALGATASWALLKSSGIRKIRGAPAIGYNGYKVLPTYHPSAVIRQYNLYPILIADLQKAAKEMHFPEVRRPQRFIHVEPTYEDLLRFERQWIDPSDSLSIDIETASSQITCIGFAPSVDRALVVPIVDDTKGDHNYWPDLETEVAVWRWIARMCSLPKAHILGQNFNFDMKFLIMSYGIPVLHASDDIMLMHHALQPELEKSLGFMGSVYTNELPWKFMRPKHNTTTKLED